MEIPELSDEDFRKLNEMSQKIAELLELESGEYFDPIKCIIPLVRVICGITHGLYIYGSQSREEVVQSVLKLINGNLDILDSNAEKTL